MAKLVGQTSTNARIIKFSGVNPNIFWGHRGAEGAENFFDFGSQNGDLWCILGAIFLQFS